MSTRPTDDLRNLSDEDVRLLYDIVNAAEASRSPPYRALFAAYDQILAARGISKENDHVYLRFLLRMGEARKEGQTLFSQFEHLLEKLGFQVAFDGDDNNNEADAESEAKSETDNQPEATNSQRLDFLQTTSFRPARRASFDSAYETINDSKPLVALPVRPKSVDGLPRSGSFHRAASSDSVRPMSRGRLNLQQRDRPSTHVYHHQHQRTSTRSASRGPHESDETLAEGSGGHNEDGLSEDSTDAQGSPPDIDLEAVKLTSPPPSFQQSQPPQTVMAPKSQLAAHARTLRYHHVAAQAVQLFRSWGRWASQARIKHQQMYQIAAERDAHTLTRQAFDQWRISLKEKRQRTETQKFYQNLERQATKARDMYLLTKAFTHWAQSASDEVARTTEARSRMLQTRYFKAWHEITAVNEIKVRRQVLSKFFTAWTDRTDDAFEQEDLAMRFRDSTLVSQAYRTWFWRFCEHRTPSWYTSKLKENLFRKWVDKARAAQERESWAVEFRSLELSSRCFSVWTQRVRAVRDGQEQAANFRRWSLLTTAEEALQRSMQFAPAQAEMASRINERVCLSALQTWRLKLNMAVQASRVNELRTMRNAWTEWNDRLRCQVLTNQINDRLLLQTLYQWVLKERLAVCKRSSAEKLAAALFERWQERLNTVSTSLGRANHLFTQARKERSLSSILKVWSTKAQQRQQENARAQDFRNRTLLSNALSLWKSRSRDVACLAKWSDDARFYVLSSNTLRAWRSAARATKKKRRREAFAEFRAEKKATSARNILARWRSAAQGRIAASQQAEEMYQRRLSAICTDIIGNWRASSSSMQDMCSQANAIYEEQLLEKCTQIILERFQQVQEATARALQLSAERREDTALMCLRRLNWNAFQLKRHHESADSLFQRTQRKHFREMLRFWATTTRERRAVQDSAAENTRQTETAELRPTGFPAQTSWSSSKTLLPASTFSHPKSIEPRTRSPPDFHSTLPLPTTTANPVTPGYLRTPSRRSITNRRTLRTPGKATVTPFISRLQAQYPSTDAPLRYRDFGRHNATPALDFEDIPESEQTDLDNAESQA